jgi:tagaturonate reductase
VISKSDEVEKTFMELLTRDLLQRGLPNAIKTGPIKESPVKVIQFGEGNFMRAFVDWMIDELNQKNLFNGMVQIIQPLDKGMAEMINAQDGLYTLILRGMKDGKIIQQEQLITCVKGCLNPYSQWDQTIESFCGSDVRFIFSNTTEAGISYSSESYNENACPATFPAKLTALLYKRYVRYNGAADKGLIIIPCELIDKNGKTLREIVLKYASEWGFENEFSEWIKKANYFVNTLVDRIVAGYPKTEIAAITDRLGYEDKLVNSGELFHFFVIEGPKELADEIPFHKIGLNVIWTKDQTPYRTRKVRFLNGAHTGSITGAFLGGFDLVDEMMEDRVFGHFVETLIKDEVFHTVNLPDDEKKFFAESVIERFKNPFAGHQLHSISLNSTAKWEVRVLPSLLDYVKIKGKLPKALTFSMASLISFYHAEKEGNQFFGKCRSNSYQVCDDLERVEYMAQLWHAWEEDKNYNKLVHSVLARKDWWKIDLNSIPGMTEYVAKALESIKTLSMRAAVKSFVCA